MEKRIELLNAPEVHVSPGDSVNVQVPARGATGNVWTVHTNSDQVRVINHVTIPSETTFGGGGVEIFTLQPLEEGCSTVSFSLGAPWKKEPAEKHELRLDVSQNPGHTKCD